jgi:hypothetical protein
MSLRVLAVGVLLAAAIGAALAGLTGSRAGAPAAPAQVAALQRAEQLVDGPGRLGYRVAVRGPRPDLRGRLDEDARTITLFLDPRDAAHRVAHDLAHELGHAYDLAHLSDADRQAYLERRGVPGATWWPATDADDYAVGAGDFAETFAACHASSPEFRSQLAAPPVDPCAMLPADARTGALGG